MLSRHRSAYHLLAARTTSGLGSIYFGCRIPHQYNLTSTETQRPSKENPAMAATLTMSPAHLSTTGTLGVWDGTKDGEDAYVDYDTFTTNMNPPKDLDITVHDLRHVSVQPTLLGNGYQWAKAPTAISTEQFIDGDQNDQARKHLSTVYFNECIDLIKNISGAAEVIPHSFRIRHQVANNKVTMEEVGDRLRNNMKSNKARMTPRPFVHLDKDPLTANLILEETVGEQRAEELKAKHKRWAQVNIWRPIGNPALRWPLCVVDHADVPDWDYPQYVGKLHSRNDPRLADRGQKPYDIAIKPDPRYRYYYVSNQAPDEVLIFCAFDTDPKLAAPHSAFWDNSTAEDAPTRRSIEVRSLVFF